MCEITRYQRELLLKCLRAEASYYEQVQAWDWIHENESNTKYYKNLREAWIANTMNEADEGVGVEKSWKRVEQKIKLPITNTFTSQNNKKQGEPIQFFVSWQKLAVAVVMALIIGGAGSVFFFSNQLVLMNNDQYSIIESPRGSKTKITLPDGSKVWLNAESRLKFKKSFNKNNRDVYLEGEGYFVVSKNENLNFKVHTSDIIINAIGTEFNVKAYAEEGRIETTLVKGAVSISRNESQPNAQNIVLKPSQRASFLVNNPISLSDIKDIDLEADQLADNEKVSELEKATPRPARITIENNINTEAVTSWKEKRWVFERERMKSLAAKLERLYDVEFIFLNPELKEFYLTGTLEEESLEQVLQALQLTLPIDFTVNHDSVYLSINQELMKSYKQILRTKN